MNIIDFALISLTGVVVVWLVNAYVQVPFVAKAIWSLAVVFTYILWILGLLGIVDVASMRIGR